MSGYKRTLHIYHISFHFIICIQYPDMKIACHIKQLTFWTTVKSTIKYDSHLEESQHLENHLIQTSCYSDSPDIRIRKLTELYNFV